MVQRCTRFHPRTPGEAAIGFSRLGKRAKLLTALNNVMLSFPGVWMSKGQVIMNDRAVVNKRCFGGGEEEEESRIWNKSHIFYLTPTIMNIQLRQTMQRIQPSEFLHFTPPFARQPYPPGIVLIHNPLIQKKNRPQLNQNTSSLPYKQRPSWSSYSQP